MRLLILAASALFSLSALAAEPALRPSARLLFKQPELLTTGTCVRYQEGGAGWIATEPIFFLQGTVVSSNVSTRRLGQCPVVPGKSLLQYDRAEFIRHVQASPCVSSGVAERDEQIGMVRIRVEDWETPYERKAENAGRLWRGNFLERKLEKGMEIDLEADLLGACSR
ncbi:MAG: hypothetical protein LWW83_15620 [Azonexaceae bacterium]|nr:hypothetical protein [Azonexaceae bacterium]